MDWRRTCAAVIPCYNEAPRIFGVVRAVQDYLPSVIVVDDGSTDGTAEKAAAAGAEVVQLPFNSGKGTASRCGWKRAESLGFQWVLMLDGDGQHAPSDIPTFFDCARETGASLVIGNRMNDVATMPRVRRWANRWMSRRLSRLTGQTLPDSQCGFRLAHLPALLALPLRTSRFEIESEMLLAFSTTGQTPAFVPVQTRYESHASKINPATDSWRWLRWRLAQRPSLRACSTIRVP
jgi:glycosyltransferase involved in cell wall biosynthesis